MNWIDIYTQGLPQTCGQYLIHYIYEGWPMVRIAHIEDETFFDENGDFSNVTHWAEIVYPKGGEE